MDEFSIQRAYHEKTGLGRVSQGNTMVKSRSSSINTNHLPNDLFAFGAPKDALGVGQVTVKHRQSSGPLSILLE
jgi:hypothetical protein